jgi:hypothetical protein
VKNSGREYEQRHAGSDNEINDANLANRRYLPKTNKQSDGDNNRNDGHRNKQKTSDYPSNCLSRDVAQYPVSYWFWKHDADAPTMPNL